MKRSILTFSISLICLLMLFACADPTEFASTSAKIHGYSVSALDRMQLGAQPGNRMLVVQSADDVEKIVDSMKSLVKKLDNIGFLNSEQRKEVKKFKKEMEWWDDVLVELRAGDITELTFLMESRAKAN
jgi:hypothetical protein